MEYVPVTFIHLFSLPLYGRHTGESMFHLFEKAMTAVCSTWSYRLQSTCSDGASNMLGCVQGIVTRVAARVDDEGCKLMRFWCGAHQLDLVVQKAAVSYCDSTFYSTLTGLIGHLRRQQNLVSEMRSKCPAVSKTRWLSLGRVIEWLVQHWDRVTAYVDDNDRDDKPTNVWWTALLSLAPMFAYIDILFKKIQHSALLVSQQTAAFELFLSTLSDLTGMLGPVSDADMYPQYEHSFHEGRFCISESIVQTYIERCGSSAALLFRTLSPTEKSFVAEAVGKFIVQLANGVHSIQVERGNDTSAIQTLPPCLPSQFANMRPAEFVNQVIRFRSRLEKSFGNSTIDSIEREHKALRAAVKSEPDTTTLVSEILCYTGFKEA